VSTHQGEVLARETELASDVAVGGLERFSLLEGLHGFSVAVQLHQAHSPPVVGLHPQVVAAISTQWAGAPSLFVYATVGFAAP
jgi:hypothetical protein